MVDPIPAWIQIQAIPTPALRSSGYDSGSGSGSTEKWNRNTSSGGHGAR